MNKLIKRIFIVLMVITCAQAFAANKKSIVCTTFPEYDWVMNVLGSKASDFDVTLLQNNGTDLHSYAPSFKDIAKISTCDLFIYVGGESDEWVEKVIASRKNKKMQIVNLLEVLGDNVKAEEVVEGMQEEHEVEHDHDHDHQDAHHHEAGHHHDESEEIEYDEHVWLSLKNAAILTKEISAAVEKLDSANADLYKENASLYINKLTNLDSEYSKAVSSAKIKTVLFADRFPFRYLTDDYGLKYFAAFVGCSAQTEASFETVIFLAGKVDSLKLNSVLTIEKSDKKIAKIIVSNTKSKNQQILEMDSLQSITQNDINNGKTYLSSMEKNLEVLKQALK